MYKKMIPARKSCRNIVLFFFLRDVSKKTINSDEDERRVGSIDIRKLRSLNLVQFASQFTNFIRGSI